MSKPNIYHVAIAADAALNGLDREITDEEMDACERIVRKAYRTEPNSHAEVVDLIDAYRTIEGDDDPILRMFLASLRGHALRADCA